MVEDDSGGGATFNIGGQQGNITNVGRDMHVHGQQTNQALIASSEILTELAQVREQVRELDLPEEDAREVDQALTEAETELQQPEPDAGRVGGHIERATEILKRVGGLATAGMALAGPLGKIGALLGPVGRSILRLLGV
ncbi:MAG TPA: hypothetical protein VF058_09515 [Actinomycetota bacterium]